MVKRLAILALALAAAIASAENKKKGTDFAQKDGKDDGSPIISVVNNQTCPPDARSADTESPHWYASPEWWLFILGVPTLVFVGYQSTLLAKHAEHFENLAKAASDNAIATKDALDLSRETAKKQLRAYFGAPEGKLYIREDGTVEARVTLTNCGQTPAFDFQAIHYSRFESMPFKMVSPPNAKDFPDHPHIVGRDQPYHFNCEGPTPGITKDALLDQLKNAGYAFKLNGWCSYVDIFGDTHHADFQLIIGAGTPIQRTEDYTGEWFGLFTDNEGNRYD